MVTDDHITYGIVDTGKRFHDRIVSEPELPIRRCVHSHRMMDNGMPAPMLIERG
jgi:hypothetical protein